MGDVMGPVDQETGANTRESSFTAEQLAKIGQIVAAKVTSSIGISMTGLPVSHSTVTLSTSPASSSGKWAR